MNFIKELTETIPITIKGLGANERNNGKEKYIYKNDIGDNDEIN